eukprot:6409039-Amphidinium_carterae.1
MKSDLSKRVLHCLGLHEWAPLNDDPSSKLDSNDGVCAEPTQWHKCEFAKESYLCMATRLESLDQIDKVCFRAKVQIMAQCHMSDSVFSHRHRWKVSKNHNLRDYCESSCVTNVLQA